MHRRALTTIRDRRDPRGIRVPLRLDPAGRTETVGGPDHLRSLLLRALSDCSNTNPFRQGLGLGVGAVFRAHTPALAAVVRARAQRIFDEHFAGRVELISVRTTGTTPGELGVEVVYRTPEGQGQILVGG